MITCSQCGSQNLPGMAYCEQCGSPLPQQAAAADPTASHAPGAAASLVTTVDPMAGALPLPIMPVDQPAVQPAPATSVPAPIDAGLAVGANAVGADIADAEALPATAPGAGTMTLNFPNGQSFTLSGDLADVGRADVAQNWRPALDVIPFGGGAPDLGVSRHHARLSREGDAYHVTDVGSTNGTYVNGQNVGQNQPAPLHNGDTLSFGALNTQVSIK